MSTPTLEEEALELVLLGSFNPRIFHPAWFLRYELIAEADLGASDVQIVNNNISQVTIRGVQIVCVNERFSFATMDPSRFEMMHDWMLKVLALLPHTPLTAAGINSSVHYRIDDEDRWHRIGNTLAPKTKVWNELFAEPGMQSLTIKAPGDRHLRPEINVVVEPSVKYSPGILLRTNYHFQPEKAETTEFARFITTAWKSATAEAKRVAASIFEKIP